MDISARSGRTTIVASAEITTFEGHPLELTLWPSPDESLVLEWSFRTDPEVEDVAVTMASKEQSLHFECVNFNTAEGRGTGKPLHLADIGGHRFWVHFRVFLYGKTEDRTVHYTIYMEEI